MRKTIFYTFALIAALQSSKYADEASAEVFFSCDFESGYQFMGVDNDHPGGGYFANMGGNVNGPPGILPNPCGDRDTSRYHYTVISDDDAAQGSIQESRYALKTPYEGHCNNESTQRDRTVINLDENKPEVYIRWYQKFTGNWMNGSVQHKLIKFLSLGQSQDIYTTAYFEFNAGNERLDEAWIRNVGGQFNTDITRAAICRIATTEAGAYEQYEEVNRYWDNYNNRMSPDCTDAEFFFTTDRWYCIEVRVKVQSDEATADAILEYWIDGAKVFSLTNFRRYGPGDPHVRGTGTFEMQSIYYVRDTDDDQPTYIDNIVIADEYIGPIGVDDVSHSPARPEDVRVRQ